MLFIAMQNTLTEAKFSNRRLSNSSKIKVF
jgi:hypothetical protein